MLEAFAAAVDAVLASGETLHGWAARAPNAKPLRGRDVAYATVLANVPVVVRHSRHGGLLAPLTQDLFLAPTRAPHELDVAIRLRAAGVPTPDIVAYATYTVIPGIERADVVTREIAGRELTSPEEAETLIQAMSRAGAVHPDFNMRNVIVDGGTAYVLDIDTVYFLPPRDRRVDERNRSRLMRSAKKLGR